MEGIEMKTRRWMPVSLCVALLVSGCTNLEVHGFREGKWTKLDGIPFYIKVPQWTQTTTRVRKELQVTVTVHLYDGEKLVESRVLPAGGPLQLIDGPNSRQAVSSALDRLLAALARASPTPRGLELVYPKLTQEVDGLLKLPCVSGAPTDNDTQMIANSWAMQMVTGEGQYQVAGRQPLFGSSESDFTFSDEGTLTQAKQVTTDETAKTLLGLFPISEKLKQRWSIEPEATSTQEAAKSKGKAKSFRLESTVTPVVTTVILRRISASKLDQKVPALTLAQATCACDGVQLVSSTTVAAGEPTAAPDPDSSASYVIEGRVTPPKSLTPHSAVSGAKSPPSK
jgi:hypothetical protein